MSAHDLEIVKEFLDTLGETDESHALDHGDVSAVEHLIHPECELIIPLLHPDRGLFTTDQVPADGILRGVKCLDEDLALMTPLFDLKVKDPVLTDCGDFVLFRGSVTVTGKETGRSTESYFMEMFFVEDGKLKRIHACHDTKAYLETLPG